MRSTNVWREYKWIGMLAHDIPDVVNDWRWKGKVGGKLPMESGWPLDDRSLWFPPLATMDIHPFLPLFWGQIAASSLQPSKSLEVHWTWFLPLVYLQVSRRLVLKRLGHLNHWNECGRERTDVCRKDCIGCGEVQVEVIPVFLCRVDNGWTLGARLGYIGRKWFVIDEMPSAGFIPRAWNYNHNHNIMAETLRLLTWSTIIM